MSDHIRNLKRDYQGIKSPAYVATRIRAEVAVRDVPRRSWLPAMAVAAVAVGALVVAPLLLQRQEAETPPAPTSMSMLARVSMHKPPMPVPGLSRIKSVSIPALPRKPDPKSESEPQSFHKSRNETIEENDHAYS